MEETIRTRITAQIRALRDREGWDYKTFASELNKKTAWAYRLEDPNAAPPTIPSLLEVAETFDVAIDVRFVPFSAVINDTVGLEPGSFLVAGFKNDSGLVDVEGPDFDSAMTPVRTALDDSRFLVELPAQSEDPIPTFAEGGAPPKFSKHYAAYTAGASTLSPPVDTSATGTGAQGSRISEAVGFASGRSTVVGIGASTQEIFSGQTEHPQKLPPQSELLNHMPGDVWLLSERNGLALGGGVK